MARSPFKLEIKKTGALNICNAIFLALASIDLFLVLRLAVILGFGIKSTSAFTFAIVTLLAGFAMRFLALKWPRFMQYWKRHEDVFLRYPYHEPKYNLEFVLTGISLSMLILVLGKRLIIV